MNTTMPATMITIATRPPTTPPTTAPTITFEPVGQKGHYCLGDMVNQGDHIHSIMATASEDSGT